MKCREGNLIAMLLTAFASTALGQNIECSLASVELCAAELIDDSNPSDPLVDLEDSGTLPNLDKGSALKGPDTDNNGVRDDIDTYISTRNTSTSQKRAALQLAQAYESVFSVDAGDALALTQSAQRLARGINCIYERFDDFTEASNLVSRLEALTYNTQSRSLAYIEFNRALDGNVVTTVKQGACNE